MSSVTVGRPEEFLWSDVCYLAEQGATPLSLCQVIAATPLQVAELANRELPIRFAKRIRQIEAPQKPCHKGPGVPLKEQRGGQWNGLRCNFGN